MAYQTVAMALALNDFEGHSPVADVFTCNPWNICATFTRFQLTMCSHGSCGLAELLVTMGNAIGSPTVKCFRFVCANFTTFPFGKRIFRKLDSWAFR